MSTIDPLTRLHVFVAGRVQGVGFRWFAKETAESLGLTGWVTNRKDGCVEAEAQGTAAGLEEFVARLKSGNPSAKVTSIETKPVDVKEETAFTII
ncbi:MAG: acylphosphatase [Elusimicrobiota bacterium]